MIGKWHLISEPQGFDHWSILSGQHEQGDYYDPDFWEDGKTYRRKGYATDIITDKAIKFLENRDKNKPFCMMYHQKAPHRNWMPAPAIWASSTIPHSRNPPTCSTTTKDAEKQPANKDMSIEHTLTNDWDLKLLTREEMLKIRPTAFTAFISACLPPYRTNGTPYMRSALPNTAKAT